MNIDQINASDDSVMQMNSSFASQENSAIEPALLFLQVLYIVEGVAMTLSNFLIVAAVCIHKPLHWQKEYIIVAGLAFGDMMLGVGTVAAGIYRSQVIASDASDQSQFIKVSQWHCVTQFHSIILIPSRIFKVGMMLAVSIDRLIVALIPLQYLTLQKTYSYTLISIFALISAFMTGTAYVTSYYHTDSYTSIICVTILSFDTTFSFFFSNFYLLCVTGSVCISLTAVLIIVRKWRKISTCRADHIQQHNKQKHLIKTVGISCTITFLFCVAPYVILFVNELHPFSPYASVFIAPINFLLFNATVVLNVVVYIKRQKEIRMGISYLFKRKVLPPNFVAI